MVKNSILILFSLCFGFASVAQTQYDSAMNSNKLKGTFEKDTVFIAKWNDLALRMASKRPDSTIYFSNMSLALAEKIHWEKGRATAYFNMGLGYRIFANYPTALANYLKSLEVFEKINDSAGIDRCYTDIATVYWFEKNYEKALAYDLKSLAIAERQKDQRRIARTLNNIGVLYHDKKDYIKALEFHKKSLPIAEKLQDQRAIASAYHNIGEVYGSMGDSQRGLEYLLKSLEIGKALEANDFVANTYVVIASVYQKEGKIQQSLEYAQKGFDLAKRIGAKEYLKDASNILYADYKKLHNLQRALEYFELYVDYKDSIDNENNHKNIIHLQTAYELEKKQRELDLLASQHKLSLIAKQVQEEDAQRNRIALYTLAVLFTLVCALLYVLYFRNREKKLLNEELLKKTKEIEQKNKELAQQQQQILEQNEQLSVTNQQLSETNAEKDGLISIVAHDLRAPLNRIKGFAQILGYEESFDEEQRMLLKRIEKTCEGGISLIKDLLTISNIEFQQPKIVVVKIELVSFFQSFLENYYTQAQAKNIHLNYISPNEPNSFLETDESFLSRILDNLLSNAIKFTYPDKNIYISHKDLGHTVQITIKDEGQGFSKDDQEKLFMKFQKLTAKPTGGEESTGLGLAIVKSLVDKLQGKINMTSEEGNGAEFTLTFPKTLYLDVYSKT